MARGETTKNRLLLLMYSDENDIFTVLGRQMTGCVLKIVHLKNRKPVERKKNRSRSKHMRPFVFRIIH